MRMRLMVVLMLAAMLVSGCGRGSVPAEKDSGTTPSWSDPLAADQQEVAAEFGPPDTFGIAWGGDLAKAGEADDAAREEWWDYPATRTRFYFRSGAFAGSEEIAPYEDGEQLYVPDVLPSQFDEGMALADVEKLLGSHTRRIESGLPGLEGASAYSWGGAAMAIFGPEGLTYIEVGTGAEGGAK